MNEMIVLYCTKKPAEGPRNHMQFIYAPILDFVQAWILQTKSRCCQSHRPSSVADYSVPVKNKEAWL